MRSNRSAFLMQNESHTKKKKRPDHIKYTWNPKVPSSGNSFSHLSVDWKQQITGSHENLIVFYFFFFFFFYYLSHLLFYITFSKLHAYYYLLIKQIDRSEMVVLSFGGNGLQQCETKRWAFVTSRSSSTCSTLASIRHGQSTFRSANSRIHRIHTAYPAYTTSLEQKTSRISHHLPPSSLLNNHAAHIFWTFASISLHLSFVRAFGVLYLRCPNMMLHLIPKLRAKFIR